jgi:hypothetical protein
MPGKYEPLTIALAAAADRGQRDAEFGFDEIGELVGGLPPSGVVVLDGDDKPTFPRLSASYGLYRLAFTGPASRVYIGETENLHRRLSTNYRNPGPSQQTSTRINALLREHLTLGGTVSLAVTTAATVVIDDRERPVDLSTKAGRLLAESAALVHAQTTGDAQIMNLG